VPDVDLSVQGVEFNANETILSFSLGIYDNDSAGAYVKSGNIHASEGMCWYLIRNMPGTPGLEYSPAYYAMYMLQRNELP
jgi:hypothetical protein